MASSDRGDTHKFGLVVIPEPSPPTPDKRLKKLEESIVEVKKEVAEWVAMQKRGNKISLELQGEMRELTKDVRDGFRFLRQQNVLIMKLLKKHEP